MGLNLGRELLRLRNEHLKTPADIAECRKLAMSILFDAHRRGLGGVSFCKEHSDFIDALVKFLYDNFIGRRKEYSSTIEKKFCIVALGGYGRRELSPHSDLDLMFLYSSGVKDDVKMLVVDQIAYPLWNVGLKLGHSSRTVSEAIYGARADIFAFTAMLDSRFLCGEKKIFNKFKAALWADASKNSESKIDELLRLKRDRHSKYGWVPFVQEPNLKNGVGGTRDIQTLGWIALLKRGNSDFKELARAGKMSRNEFRLFLKARDFILRVRNEAHFFFNRENDLLDLESQSAIAKNLGFFGDDEDRAEYFMRKVYTALRTVDSVTKATRKRMGIILPEDVSNNMRLLGVRVKRSRKIGIDGFTIWRGEIENLHFGAFKRKPWRLISVFRYAQRYSAVPSDRLEIEIKDSISLIDNSLRENPIAKKHFLEILFDKGSVAPYLELMHFCGVLGAFIPEFADITCRVQRELYHRYTVDVHTLNTIAVLDKIFCSRIDSVPFGTYHTVLTSLQVPELAYLILFLHDIAKSEGVKGHAESSAEIAEKILKRFDIPESEAEIVLFCIRNHLEMVRFWQTRDLDDESSIREFASKIPNVECLKFLYVITFCDAMGTSNSLWNSYKESLHKSLFERVSNLMLREAKELRQERRTRREMVITELLSRSEFADKEELLLEHISQLPKNYFMHHGGRNLAMHIAMIDKLRNAVAENPKSPVSPIIEWREDPNRSLISVCVVSTDRKGLFAAISGALSLSGLSILGSKIFTRSDGITIDTFYVTGISMGAIKNKNLRGRIVRKIVRAIDDSDWLKSKFCGILEGVKKQRLVSEAKFCGEIEGLKILEIYAPDSAGLLYRISSTINDCGYDINFAYIDTSNKKAIDTFLIKPREKSCSQEILLEKLLELKRYSK